MKARLFTFLLAFAIILIGCGQSPNSNSNSNAETGKAESGVKAAAEAVLDTVPQIELSFSFLGCNRVQRGDQSNPAATNASSANVNVLKRIFNEMPNEERKPELFFFLGDLVYAESTLELLNSQLKAWVPQYKDSSFSPLYRSGIELVAVPGNHEMLYWADHNVPGHDEWPLKGATEIWMQYMGDFMPKDRIAIRGADSLINRATFAFHRKNVGFVVMNTDTYNDSTELHPWGLEGQIPLKWIMGQITDFKNDPNIDHIFVLGHKPYYVNGDTVTGHDGLPEGPVLWPHLRQTGTVAMLSAHVHDYQRMQPEGDGTYQVIAGNGGSDGPATFFGYTTINVWSDGRIELIAKGFDKGVPYYAAVPDSPTTVRDSTTLSWTPNANPYQ